MTPISHTGLGLVVRLGRKPEPRASPHQKLLNVDRTTITMLLSMSLCLIYLCGTHDTSLGSSLIVALLLDMNSLQLIHGRRSTTEGTALFGATLCRVSVSQRGVRPWLVGLPLAVAISAKQSILALVPAELRESPGLLIRRKWRMPGVNGVLH